MGRGCEKRECGGCTVGSYMYEYRRSGLGGAYMGHWDRHGRRLWEQRGILYHWSVNNTCTYENTIRLFYYRVVALAYE